MAKIAARGELVVVGVGPKLFLYHIGSLNQVQFVSSVEICSLTKELLVHDDKQAPLEANPSVLTVSFANKDNVIAVGTSSKVLLLVAVEKEFRGKKAFRIPKSPTCAIFDEKDEFVVVSDRAGSVRRYPLDSQATSENRAAGDDEDPDEVGFEGEFLCSAISMTLSLSFSSDGRFLLVCDRDEKLRVYQYPQAFVIQSFCLAHKEFVSSVCTCGSVSYSTGGDSVVYAWDIETGTVLGKVEQLNSTNGGRVIRAFQKNGASYVVVLLDRISEVRVFSIQQDVEGITLAQAASYKGRRNVMDISVARDGAVILGVSAEGLEVFPFPDAGSVADAADALPFLADAQDPIEDLKKKTGYDNMAEYQSRKRKRIHAK